ncbi:hypothetical protein GOODEAATRI_012687 [Goodea atripinnis]|uniref:Uncharacterized protein n=1 Tax=Goodea atripinnis TaxID=208336 RepID=A0ABV0NA72_9TELE
MLSIPEPVIVSEDMELKQEGVLMSPPASDSGSSSPPQFSPYCVDSEPGSPLLDHHQVKSEPDSPSTVGVMDRSRLLLCALTFFCLSLNPLPSLLGSEDPENPGLTAAHVPSRTLVWFPTHTQDFGEEQSLLHISEVLYLWEPVTPLHSPKSVSFWRHRKQADLHLNRGDYTAAMASLETCLSVLTRALPSSGLDLVCSLSWNLIRYCLHRPVPFGWLVHQVGGKYEGEEAKTSAKDAALVYHQLSQLQLTGKLPQRSSLWALSLSLSAVNLSESAQGKMAPAQFAQIYVTAATALRTVLGHHLTFLSGYLIGCAESVANQSETKQIPDCLRWLFTPLGRQFFLSCDWSVKSDSIDEVFTSQRDPADPIAQLHQCFCRKLLERAVHTLIQPQSDSDAGGCKNNLGHPLPKAVLLLCKVVQLSLSTLKGDGVVACLSHCDRASGYLRSSISVPLAQSGNWLNKVFLHETTVRLIAGASPTRTHQLLEHNLRRRTHSSYSADGECIVGERERAHAILLACRHLPMPLLTPPGHRARLLAEAKRTLERVGDRRSVQDCQQILLRLSGGTTIAAS